MSNAAGPSRFVSKINNVVTGLASSSSSSSSAGVVHGAHLDCFKAMHQYIAKMIASSTVPGMKAMLVDEMTKSMVGLVFTQSELIASEVFLVESLSVVSSCMIDERAEDESMKKQLRKGVIMSTEQAGINEQSMQHMKAIVFVQPNTTTLDSLAVLLKSPRYKEYHIFFSNIVPAGYLDALAALDVYEFVHSVSEFYADYYVVGPSLFHFNADASTSRKAFATPAVRDAYGSEAKWVDDREFQGLLSVLLSLKKRPDIRYIAGSSRCQQLGLDLVHTMRAEQELFTFQGEPTLLLLLDRKEDVVTPMLTQWTYQSMVHQLLGINMNRVLLSAPKTPAPAPAANASPAAIVAASREADALRDVVLCSEQDKFFASTLHIHFGELGKRIKALVAEFQSMTKVQTKLESVEDMQQFVDNYPQFRMQSLAVSKHVSVMHDISRIVNERRLLLVSHLEQTIVCGTDHAVAYDMMSKLMSGQGFDFVDKLRCVTLYALRYEHHPSSHLASLRGTLRAHALAEGFVESVVDVIDQVLEQSGSQQRTWPLFQDSDDISMKGLVNQIQLNVKGGVDNIYTQHRCMMHDILLSLYAGDLKTSQFPFIDGGNAKTVYRRVIVFVVGGCTYEESAAVENLMASNKLKGNFTTIVGGSCIHNSESFLREIVDIEKYKTKNNHQQYSDTPFVQQSQSQSQPQSQQPRRPQQQRPPAQPSDVRLTIRDDDNAYEAANTSNQPPQQQQPQAQRQPRRAQPQPQPQQYTQVNNPSSSSSSSFAPQQSSQQPGQQQQRRPQLQPQHSQSESSLLNSQPGQPRAHRPQGAANAQGGQGGQQRARPPVTNQNQQRE